MNKLLNVFIWTVIVYSLAAFGVNSIISKVKSTEHQNVYYNTGKVVALGQCTNSDQCSFQYTDKNGELKFATSSKPVVLGQLVYQECWYEEAQGNQCYVEYQPSKN